MDKFNQESTTLKRVQLNILIFKCTNIFYNTFFFLPNLIGRLKMQSWGGLYGYHIENKSAVLDAFILSLSLLFNTNII